LLQRAIKVVHALSAIVYFSSVQVSDDFEAQIRGAANALRNQDRSDVIVVSPMQLSLSQLLNNDGGRPDVIHGIPELVEEAKIDAFGPERFFEILQLDIRFLDL
jgi:hypothetical protein